MNKMNFLSMFCIYILFCSMGPGDLDGGCCNNPAMRLSSFLPAHPSLEVLYRRVNLDAATRRAASVHLVPADGALPCLREAKVSIVSLG